MSTSINDLAASILKMDEVNTDDVVMTTIVEATWIQFRLDDDDFSFEMIEKFDDIEFMGTWMLASQKVFKQVEKLAKQAGVNVERK